MKAKREEDQEVKIMSKEKNERLPGDRSQRRGKKVGNMEPNWRKTQKWE